MLLNRQRKYVKYCDKEMEHKAVKKKKDTLVFLVS